MTLTFPVEVPHRFISISDEPKIRNHDYICYKSAEDLLERGPYAPEYDLCPDNLSSEHRLLMIERMINHIAEGSLHRIQVCATLENPMYSPVLEVLTSSFGHCLNGIRPTQLEPSTEISPSGKTTTWYCLLPTGTQLEYAVTRRRHFFFGQASFEREIRTKIFTVTADGVSQDAHLDPTGTDAALRFERIHMAVNNLQMDVSWDQNLKEALLLATLPKNKEWPQADLEILDRVKFNLTQILGHQHETSPLDCCLPLIKQTRAILEQALRKSNYSFMLGAELPASGGLSTI